MLIDLRIMGIVLPAFNGHSAAMARPVIAEYKYIALANLYNIFIPSKSMYIKKRMNYDKDLTISVFSFIYHQSIPNTISSNNNCTPQIHICLNESVKRITKLPIFNKPQPYNECV